jgi:hypothetical protein
MKRIVGWLMMLCLMCLVVACSDPDQGPPLGPFAAITKTETDAPFNIVPPTSKSPADFSYTSSNPAVATIAGSLVTIKGAGQSTITASQGSVGGWGPTSATTTLTVTAVACPNSNEVRINGICTPVPSCVPPAVLTNNQCIPPVTSATAVRTDVLWMGVSYSDNWTKARDFCATSTIEGATGWHQPSEAQLKALQASGAISGHGWAVGPTWSADMGTASNTASHVAVDLSSGASIERADVAGAYVSCVR